MIFCPVIILKLTSAASRLPAHLFLSPGDETSGIPIQKDRGNAPSPFCSHGKPTAYGGRKQNSLVRHWTDSGPPIFFIYITLKCHPSHCQGLGLFHEFETGKRQTFIHMGTFMSNGNQTVVRETFHRIGVPERYQSTGWVQFCNEFSAFPVT